ncbi:hypothetical protein ACWD26_13295 [Streptomyces sp. NPDC002787]
MSGDEEETARPDGSPPLDAVMATFGDWLDHAVACKDACRREGVSCLHSMRLGKRHREARRAAARAARRTDGPPELL